MNFKDRGPALVRALTFTKEWVHEARAHKTELG